MVEVDGSTVRVDYSNAPDPHPGPINTPIASTVSGSRIAIAMLAGGNEGPNEGHFRPLEVVARPGSMFHPLPPSPCFLYAWPTFQAMEAIYDAVAKAVPEARARLQQQLSVRPRLRWGIRRGLSSPERRSAQMTRRPVSVTGDPHPRLRRPRGALP